MKYVIACDASDRNIYWSNAWGWTSLSEADQFDAEDRETCSLPMDGYWMKYEQALLLEGGL